MGRLIKKVNLYIIEVLVQLMDYIISGCLGSTVVALLSFVVLEEMLCSWQIIFFDYSKRAPIWNKGVLVFCLQATRSEERRVGKECRWPGWRWQVRRRERHTDRRREIK